MSMRSVRWGCLFVFFLVLSPELVIADPNDPRPGEGNNGFLDQLREVLGPDNANPDAASGEAGNSDKDKDEPLEALDVAIVNSDTGHFRVSISYDKPPPGNAKELTLTIRSSASDTKLQLTPSEDGMTFESGLLQLVAASLRGDPRFPDGRPARERLDAKYARSAEMAAKLFAGPWLVTHTARGGETVDGLATVAADGKSARLALYMSEKSETYVSDDLLAVPDSVSGKHSLEIRFRPEQKSTPIGPELPPATIIYVPGKTQEIDMQTPYQTYSWEVPVWQGDGPEDIKVLLGADNATNLHGGWSLEAIDGALSGGGQQSWKKGTDFVGIQFRRNDGSLVRSGIEELKYGEEFKIEVEFEAKPEKKKYVLDLRLLGKDKMKVEVSAVEPNSNIYQSNLIIFDRKSEPVISNAEPDPPPPRDNDF